MSDSDAHKPEASRAASADAPARAAAGGGPARRRGRPRRSKPPLEHPLPVENPLSALSPTARHILATARRLLLERGFAALTIENIALEAGETKGSVTHHFGSKAGLVETLFDSLSHDTWVALSVESGKLPPGEERIGHYIDGVRDIAGDAEAYRAFYAIAPHAMRDRDLRSRMVALYDWYRRITLEACGVEQGATEAERGRRRAVAALILAAMDGLAFQFALDAEAFDETYALDLLKYAVRRGLDESG